LSDKSLQVPTTTRGDAAIAVARAGAGCIPIVGAAATELFNWFVKSPLDRRRNEWMLQVGETLESLRMRGIDVEALQKDEAFVDVVMQATGIAMRNHEEKKREALRNAIANSAAPGAPSEAKRQMFLHSVDVLTVCHLQLLNLFADPRRWFTLNGKQPPSFSISSSLAQVVGAAFPGLAGESQKDFCELLWKDLADRGFHRTGGLHTSMTANGAWEKRATPLGEEFLAFIGAAKTG